MKEILLSCCAIVMILHFAVGKVKTATAQLPINDPKTISSQNPYDMDSWSSEKLTVSFELPNCPWVKIIEWRAPSKTNKGGPSELAKKILGETCVKTVKSFPVYIKSNKYKIAIDINAFHQSLSLIPALEESDGLLFRNLNDSIFRFRDREKTYDDQGRLNIIWGYTNFHNSTSYIRNDVINEDGTINKKTITIFAHELYHAMSWQFHVNDIYHNDAKIEEEMAMKFTQFLGYGR